MAVSAAAVIKSWEPKEQLEFNLDFSGSAWVSEQFDCIGRAKKFKIIGTAMDKSFAILKGGKEMR